VRHPVVGDLDLYFNRLIVPGDHGLSFTTDIAALGTMPVEGLLLLGNWAAAASLRDERQELRGSG
jgi:hypothetical protein